MVNHILNIMVKKINKHQLNTLDHLFQIIGRLHSRGNQQLDLKKKANEMFNIFLFVTTLTVTVTHLQLLTLLTGQLALLQPGHQSPVSPSLLALVPGLSGLSGHP